MGWAIPLTREIFSNVTIPSRGKSKRIMKTIFSLASTLLLTTSALPGLPQTAPSSLPVRQVTLFTSGVSYTERGGMVDGDASVPLLFRTEQINDILKSMILLDATGQVQPATYATRDSVSRALQSFAVDMSSTIRLEDILNRLHGASVSVQSLGKPAITGQIIGVEQRRAGGDDAKPVNASYLNLFTDNGLVSLRLDGEQAVRFLDARLNKEFRDALTLLASGSDDTKRQVMLHFAGNGRREVRVGYVSEAPLWKMSYRLMLDGAEGAKPAQTPKAGNLKTPSKQSPKPLLGTKADAQGRQEQANGKPYIQGWAVVENTSDEDWQGVRLSLVSGRPVSFIQDLYQPLYLPRPVVGPDVVASPYPQIHEGDLQNSPVLGANGAFGGGAGGFGRGDAQRNRAPQAQMGPKGDPGPSNAPSQGFLDGISSKDIFALDADNSLVLRYDSVKAQAAGQKAGELFQYNINTPVTLPRQQAAMIPVIAQGIEAEKALLFNADSGIRFPMNAVRIHNTTTLHLKGGPVTLLDGGVYAGDARMEDIPPGDSRLITYAVDLTVEGERQGPGTDMIESTLTLKRGVLLVSRREHVETTYTLKSKSDKPKTVLIEHPFRAEYKLLSPEKATERAASLYRFTVAVPPGKSQTLKVVVERPIAQEFGIFDGDLNALTGYSTRKDISPKLRATLEDVVKRRRQAQELQAQAAARTAESQTIDADQDRIRKNMAALDKDSALYKRYVATLDTQETKLENLRQEAIRLKAQADEAYRALRVYIDGLGAIE